MWNVKSVISCACHDFVAFGFFMSGLNRLDVLTSHDVDDGDQCLLTWHSKICLKDVSDLFEVRVGLCLANTDRYG